MIRKTLRPRVAYRHRRVALQEQQRGRFADEVAATHHHRVRTLDLDARSLEQKNDAGRGAGLHATSESKGHESRVDWMKAIDVLDGVERQDHLPHVYVLWRRLLDEDRAHRVVPIQGLDHREELFCGRARREPLVF